MAKLALFVLISFLQTLTLSFNTNAPVRNEVGNILKSLLCSVYYQETCIAQVDCGRYSQVTNSDELECEKYIPIIHIKTLCTHEILLRAMNEGCNTFIIMQRNISQLLYMLKQATVETTQRKKRNYIVVQEHVDQSLTHFLESEFMLFFPYTYIIKPRHSSTKQYDIVSHTIGNNLKPHLFEVTVPWENLKRGDTSGLIKDKLDNLNGVVLDLMWFAYFPYAFGEGSALDGTDYRVTKELELKYNFTWDFCYPSRKAMYGSVLDNASTESYYGCAKSGKYQMTVMSDVSNEEHYQLMYQSVPYLQTSISFLTPKPKRKTSLWSIFFPLSPPVWCFVLGFVIFSSFLLYSFSFILWRLINYHPGEYQDCIYCLMASISIIVGISVHSSNSVMTMLLAWLFITSMLIITAYNSNLVSFLTYPLYSTPIDTVEQFLASKLQWGTDDLLWVELLNVSADSARSTVTGRYMLITDYEKLNNMLKEGKIAVVVEKLACGYLSNTDALHQHTLPYLRIMTQNMLSSDMVFSFWKGSPFVDKVNVILRILDNAGIVRKWQLDIVDEYRDREFQRLLGYEKEIGESLRPLAMDDLYGIFVFLVIGLLLDLLIFTTEFLHYKCKV